MKKIFIISMFMFPLITFAGRGCFNCQSKFGSVAPVQIKSREVLIKEITDLLNQATALLNQANALLKELKK